MATIDKFFKRQSMSMSMPEENDQNPMKKPSNQKFDISQLPTDPGLRPPIADYNFNVRDEIRRAYLQRGPCQPQNITFPTTMFGDKPRQFKATWFDDHRNWLEYSIEKDALFCLCCYLFKSNNGEQGCRDSFVSQGFHNWKKKQRLQVHVGGVGSSHNKARNMCDSLMNQEQHIQTILFKQSQQTRSEYRIRLGASVDCVRFLLRRGLAFRGHDESEDSNNQGNFLELLQFLADHNDEIKAVTLKNAPENLKLTSPDIQKDIVCAVAAQTIGIIIEDVGDCLFSVLIDESRDISIKEQMCVVLRYVNKIGHVIECFVGIEHVSSTTALSLKAALDKLFSRYGLSIDRLRGQGYDGASNMKGEFNGLKALILKENPCAFYIHCFAHQLQLSLVSIAKKQTEVDRLFSLIANVVNVVGASAKRSDLLREKQAAKIYQALNDGEMSSGRGLNQETSLKRSGDTRWGSHYGTLLNLMKMFSAVVDVLDMISVDGSISEKKGDANYLLELIQSFDFVFNMILMKNILAISNDLSKALQRKDQDIVNAMSLVKICKQRLQMMRENGWDLFLEQVTSFCQKHDIDVLDMNGMVVRRGRSRRNVDEMTNLHHYRVDIFYAIIDTQLQELNDRFSEVTTELLLCIASLCPSDSFSAFDKEKLIRLAQYYQVDFSEVDLMVLDDQLETYILDVRSSKEFRELRGISELAHKLIATKKDRVYPLLYKLLTLALILPVATASVERVFSVMNIVKSRLRNRMGD